jgi:hypothetical protein
LTMATMNDHLDVAIALAHIKGYRLSWILAILGSAL